MSCKYSKILTKSSKNYTVWTKVLYSNNRSTNETYNQYYKRKLCGVENVRLNDRRFLHSSNVNECRAVAKLSQNEVNDILRTNEYSHEYTAAGPVRSYDSNQLASNSPIEDARAEAACLLTKGSLFGVFDGHAGAACAQVISKRLYYYIAASLLPRNVLHQFISTSGENEENRLVQFLNDKIQFVDDIKEVYRASFDTFLTDLIRTPESSAIKMTEVMESAFLRLDSDMSREALTPSPDGKLNIKTLSVAMSGSVTCVAHVDGPHLHVANVGDCCAVLGSFSSEDSTWQATKLTTEHNSANTSEVDRIISEHPQHESESVIKMERLLGQLAPLRAMGDFRYKWSVQQLKEIAGKYVGEHILPPHYHTPPYLSAKPDVVYRRLSPRDRFLVLATDGLWDIVSPLQVVRLVGEHLSGRVTLSPLRLPRKNMRLGEISDMLNQRRSLAKLGGKPLDRNAATHLIRNALGGTDYGIDHARLSQLLTLPDDVVRVFRDDISITVVYFDPEFLSQCPI